MLYPWLNWVRCTLWSWGSPFLKWFSDSSFLGVTFTCVFLSGMLTLQLHTKWRFDISKLVVHYAFWCWGLSFLKFAVFNFIVFWDDICIFGSVDSYSTAHRIVRIIVLVNCGVKFNIFCHETIDFRSMNTHWCLLFMRHVVSLQKYDDTFSFNYFREFTHFGLLFLKCVFSALWSFLLRSVNSFVCTFSLVWSVHIHFLQHDFSPDVVGFCVPARCMFFFSCVERWDDVQ